MAGNTKIITNKYLFIDVSFLILSIVVAVILTLVLPINLFVSTLLFFSPQALYISWRRKDVILRSLIYSLATTIISVFTDYLAEKDQSWVSTSSFSFKIAGAVPIEALLWVFLFTYLILVYYQFFFDKTPHKLLGRRMRFVFIAVSTTLAWLLITTMGNYSLVIHYFYIKFGLLFILLPLIGFLVYFPRYIGPLLKTAPYFIALGLINLLVSLEKGYWTYPGQHFVGWVQLGSYRFPFEELLFWIILYSSFVISQFEFFAGDHLKIHTVNSFRSNKT